ncbi:MAG: site-specific integrase [Syntrophales bacterium]
MYGLSKNTGGGKDLRKSFLVLREFMEFIEKAGVHDFRSLRANIMHDYCMSRGNRTAATWPSYISIVRRFLHYVFMREGMEQDLSSALGGAKRYRHTGLHDVLTEAELDKLLACTGRSNELGRRDYAMLLIGARYGMRPCDIRKFSLDDIHWRDNHITFRQSKTGKRLSLPLLPEVTEALIDYLRAGRPPTMARNIFIRHRAPFEPFAPADNLASVMIRALKRAGLDQRPGSRGFYLLRHTLATRMLGVNVPLKMIGDILGHTSTESTLGYTKVDLPALRTASLSIAEVLQ